MGTAVKTRINIVTETAIFCNGYNQYPFILQKVQPKTIGQHMALQQYSAAYWEAEADVLVRMLSISTISLANWSKRDGR